MSLENDEDLYALDGVGNVIGQPDDAGAWHLQETEFNCAVTAQMMVLHEFGVPVGEVQLTHDAVAHGWLIPDSGTALGDVGKLLDLHGVESHYGQGMKDLIRELEHGYKAILAVDARELWEGSPMASDLRVLWEDDPNHALVVQGMKHGADGDWTVVVNDPGDPHGAGREYPLDQFYEAWKDSQCLYVATNQAPFDLVENAYFGNGFNADQGLYAGMTEWLVQHSVAFAKAIGYGGVGLVAGLTIQSVIDEEQADRERNRLLRDL